MKWLLVFFVLVIALSCSKEKRIDRKLDGTWQVTMVRIENGEGFIFDDSLPKGELLFDVENNAVTGQVNFNYSTSSLSVCQDSLSMSSFAYQLDTELGRFYAGKNGLTYDFRIIVLTRTDLQIEYYDIQKYQLKRFILKKIED
jgi:hypothetical protein